MRILIANRGEIARRVIRTAHRLGHETVAVFAEPDADAPHVSEATFATPIGPANLAHSYLAIDKLIEAAELAGADAVHPGYGFLSENAGFARAVTEAGLIWIGPSPDAIDRMGSKIDARRLATSAGVPVIPGFDESQDPELLRAAAGQIGYPILVKAAAGGGGKGIRIAHDESEFEFALHEAMAEAERSFGDSQMIVERYITQPRHVEVQVVGDKHGTVIELGTRECSVQRRYQKVLEEAPAPNLPDATRAGLRAAAANLARSIGYDSTGTVEFVVDHDSGAYFFLEMNTRLQVEHPVTEAITGLDLVELQIRVAAGENLPVAQDDVTFDGHAFEARINAEDAANDFAPQIGTISHLSVPDGVRWDSAIVEGSEITPHYDPMIAKLIVHGPNREAARLELAAALDRLLIGGLVANGGFHRWLIDQPPVVAGEVTTRFLDEVDLEGVGADPHAPARAAAAWYSDDARRASRSTTPWAGLHNRHFTPHRRLPRFALRDSAGVVHEPTETAPPLNGVHVDPDAGVVVVNVAGQSHTFQVLSRSEAWAPDDAVGHGSANAIAAPFPALVTEVAVSPGDTVAAGDPVVVIEAMKMLHTLAAAGPGTVDEVRIAVGDQVVSDQVLVTFATPDEESP